MELPKKSGRKGTSRDSLREPTYSEEVGYLAINITNCCSQEVWLDYKPASPDGSVDENPSADAGDTGLTPGHRRSHVVWRTKLLRDNFWACACNQEEALQREATLQPGRSPALQPERKACAATVTLYLYSIAGEQFKHYHTWQISTYSTLQAIMWRVGNYFGWGGEQNGSVPSSAIYLKTLKLLEVTTSMSSFKNGSNI